MSRVAGLGGAFFRSRASTDHNPGPIIATVAPKPASTIAISQLPDHAKDIQTSYKVDRLTRSLADFAEIVETLDAKGVSPLNDSSQRLRFKFRFLSRHPLER